MQTVDLNTLLNALNPLMLQLLGEAKTCWLLLASIQIIYAGGMYMFGAAPKWSAFTYPIAALILLENYDDLVRTIVSIPDTLGFNFLDNALSSTEAQWQRFLEVFFIDDITLGGLITEGLWSVLLGVCTFFTWMFALVAYFLLLHAQYAAVGVLYVVGPFAVLAAATRGTFSYFLRWVTTCVECGSWTLIMGILLSSAVKMAESITVITKPNWDDPESWRAAFMTMGVMLLFGLLFFFTPFIARVLVGGGMGAIAGGAGLLLGKVAAGAATGGAAGVATGGVAGGLQGAVSGAMSSLGIRGLDSGKSGGGGDKGGGDKPGGKPPRDNGSGPGATSSGTGSAKAGSNGAQSGAGARAASAVSATSSMGQCDDGMALMGLGAGPWVGMGPIGGGGGGAGRGSSARSSSAGSGASGGADAGAPAATATGSGRRASASAGSSTGGDARGGSNSGTGSSGRGASASAGGSGGGAGTGATPSPRRGVSAPADSGSGSSGGSGGQNAVIMSRSQVQRAYAGVSAGSDGNGDGAAKADQTNPNLRVKPGRPPSPRGRS